MYIYTIAMTFSLGSSNFHCLAPKSIDLNIFSEFIASQKYNGKLCNVVSVLM